MTSPKVEAPPDTSDLDRPPRRHIHRRLALAAVVCAAGLLYVNALDNPFVYDDHWLISENRNLEELRLRALLIYQVSRPLTNLSYALDSAVFGNAPFGFHLTNVLLHMLNVALLYLLAEWLAAERLRRGERSRAGSARRPHIVAITAAALFAVHPMMTQAVGYISGRSEVLCASLFMLTLLCACRWMVEPRRRWLGLVMVGWLLALLTKETAVMLPLAVLACDRWILRGGDEAAARRRLVMLHLPLFGLLALAVTIRLLVFGILEHGGDVRADWRMSLVGLDMARRYLWMLIRPEQQMIFHTIDPIRTVLEARAISGAAVVTLLLALVWRLRRSHATASVGLLWFIALLVPSTVLVVLGRAEPFAEHRVYLASCGLFIAAGALTDHLGRRFAGTRTPRFVLRAACAVLLLSLAGRTFVRNIIWNDPVTLWEEASTAAPDHWLPYVPMGEELHRRGRHDEAIIAFQNALRLRPEEQSAYGKMGVCLVEVGLLDAASAVFEKLGQINPGSAESPYGQGLIAAARGRYDEARELLLLAKERDPSNPAVSRALIALEGRQAPER